MALKQIEIDDKKVFESYRNPSIMNSEYQFTTLFAWAEKYKFSYQLYNGTLFVFGRQNNGNLQCYFPLGYSSLEKSLEHIQSVFRENHAPLNLRPLSEEMLQRLLPLMKKEVSIGSKPSYTDYICDFQSLLNYSDARYKRKRKSANAFYKKYEYAYRPLCADNIESAARGLYKILSDSPQGVDFDEWQADLRILTNFDRLNLKGGMIVIDQKIAALSVAEALFDTVYIHIRRCDKSFSGIYPAMLQLLLKNAFSGHAYRYVNLQDDMGVESLRRAKLSYKPVILLKKYYMVETGESDGGHCH